jgi:hypothetical protein
MTYFNKFYMQGFSNYYLKIIMIFKRFFWSFKKIFQEYFKKILRIFPQKQSQKQ